MNELMDLKERMEHERPAQWHELPDIALYMDQIIAYMPRQLSALTTGRPSPPPW